MNTYNQKKRKNAFTANDKFFFCIYFNYAQNNIFAALSMLKEYHLSNDEWRKEIPKNENYGEFIKTFLPDTKAITSEIQDRLLLLSQAFPFIRRNIDIDEYKQQQEHLIRIFERITNLRNYFSHGYYETNELDSVNTKELTSIMRTIKAEAAKALTKAPYTYKEEHIEHLQQDWQDKQLISFYCCLFLTKKQGYEFLKRQAGFKDSREQAHRATLDAYTHFHIKLPTPVLNTDNRQLQFILDGLNELNRCPKEVYNRLSDKEKEKYTVEVPVLPDDQTKTYEAEENTTERRPHVRHSNRFAYFALRYFDEQEVFDKLRFQVEVGKRMERFHTHDTYTQPVTRHKAVYTYARLPEMWEDNKYMKKESDQYNIKQPNLINYNPHYNLQEKTLGMVLHKNKHLHLPDLNDPTAKATQPDVMLSIYELSNMVYAVVENKATAVEKRIENFFNVYRDFLKQIIATPDSELKKQTLADFLSDFNNSSGINFQLLPQHMPKELRKLFHGTSITYKQKALNKIQEWKRENKQQERKLKYLRTGELATLIARETQRFLPPGNKMQLHELNEWQKQLAYYRKKEIWEYIKEYKLSYYNPPQKYPPLPYCEQSHPFFHDFAFKQPETLADFAGKYLEAKEKWLDRVEKFIKKLGNQEIKSHTPLFALMKLGTSTDEQGEVVYYKQYNWQGFKQKCNKWLQHPTPINLPRGLFDDLIVGHNKTEEIKPQIALSRMLPNIQAFYNCKRFYEIPENQNQEDTTYLTHEEVHQAFAMRNKETTREDNNKGRMPLQLRKIKNAINHEQKIRYLQKCDRLLWLMIHKTWENKESKPDIKDIAHLDNLLDKEQVFSLNSKLKLQFKERLRNYGKIVAYLKDPRLRGMLTLHNITDLTEQGSGVYQFLQKLVHQYQWEQWSIIQTIQQLENKTVAKFGLEVFKSKIINNPKEEWHGFVPFRMIISKLQDTGIAGDMEIISLARNNAAHSTLNNAFIKLLKSKGDRKDYHWLSIDGHEPNNTPKPVFSLSAIIAASDKLRQLKQLKQMATPCFADTDELTKKIIAKL